MLPISSHLSTLTKVLIANVKIVLLHVENFLPQLEVRSASRRVKGEARLEAAVWNRALGCHRENFREFVALFTIFDFFVVVVAQLKVRCASDARMSY
jgi:hypothetical protein